MKRVILDEGVPRQVGDHLSGHSVTTVPIEGWASVKNGELLALIEEAGFDAFITADKNLEAQQSLQGATICDSPAEHESLAIDQAEREQNIRGAANV